MSKELKIKQFGLSVEFSGDVNYHMQEKFALTIQNQIADGVAAAAKKFEEDYFLQGSGNIIGQEPFMNSKMIELMGMEPDVSGVHVRDAAKSVATPEENVLLYEEGDWRISRNKLLGLYILYKGLALMFIDNEVRKDMPPEVPPHIREKWKFLCEMDK